ncbi:FAD/NAD(P)-binding protein [Marinoscillum pacificum]|uniref:FAD/NAD(P)-binding protein n=1 Tax=Marinoscillum pacificum TaxID=392723 RepID=UPI00215763F9|nr:FAD/NAD(P)-binding protein [Marinoscillum pacificum]
MRNFQIAIVGGGPKGLYALERLLANLSTVSLSFSCIIHLFEGHAQFGSGQVYRIDQEPFLIMNIRSKSINVWQYSEPSPVVSHQYSFDEWRDYQGSNIIDSDYPPRALVGSYLRWAYDKLIESVPQNVYIHEHHAEVVKLKSTNEGVLLIDSEPDEKQILCDSVLLATGHPRRTLTKGELVIKKCLKKFEDKHFVEFPYPLQTLDPLNDTVAIKGMGLTFIDVVLALTEGRGGQFIEGDSGMSYLASGNEPTTIYAFSRSGKWMHCRGALDYSYQPVYFTRHAIDQLRKATGKLHLERDLVPLIFQEFRHAYYMTLFQKYNFMPGCCDSYHDLIVAISIFSEAYPHEPLFNPQELLEPLMAPGFQRPEDIHRCQKERLKEIITMAEEGPELNPIASIGYVWTSIVDVFDDVYRFGGLSAKCQETFDQKYAPFIQRISYGPPLENMKKIYALVQASLLNLGIGACSDITFDAHTGNHVISSKLHGEQVIVGALVDARIPKVDCVQDTGLYGNMVTSGEASLFINEDVLGNKYTPGCLQQTSKGEIINQYGLPNSRVYVTGIPTTGITYDNESISPLRNDEFIANWVQNVIRLIGTVNNATKKQPQEI